jgi:5-formyltetrahydrofolate cyclo-ligase
MLYASYASEVRTQELVGWALEHGKDVVLPKVRREPKGLLVFKVRAPHEQLRPGPRGIPEPMPERCAPVDIGEINFVVAPGVAFDGRGVRLGQGGGYYDRFLARLRRRPDHPPVAGAAFELQIVERVPAEPHDARVDMIVTEERVLHVEAFDADRPTSD